MFNRFVRRIIRQCTSCGKFTLAKNISYLQCQVSHERIGFIFCESHLCVSCKNLWNDTINTKPISRVDFVVDGVFVGTKIGMMNVYD